MDNNYQLFLAEIKSTIQVERTKAARQLTQTVIGAYLKIGQQILESQKVHGWGKGIVEQLSKDLRQDFPGTEGFSARNLWNMRLLYETYCDHPILLQLVAEIPWGQNLVILNKSETYEQREFYIQATAKMGWSRDVLLNQMKAQAYERQLLQPNQTNFQEALPEHLAEQANEALKSKYHLDFLGIGQPVLELELERQLIRRLKDFLLELGYGFTFIGNQYPLKLGEKTYHVDLLFFHRGLRCLVAIDLKVGAFKPEYAGKMNFHLELLDEQAKMQTENPSIGIILCAEKDSLEVEYALRTSNKPMGVAEYQLSPELPEGFSGLLPSPDEIKSFNA